MKQLSKEQISILHRALITEEVAISGFKRFSIIESDEINII